MFVGVAVGTGVGEGVAVEVGAGVGVFVGAGVGTGVGDGVMVAVGDGVGVVVGEGVGAAVGEGVTTSVCVVCVSVGAAVRTGGMVVGESVAVVVGVVVGDAVGTGAGVLAEHATRDMTSAPNSSSAGIGVRMAYVMRVFSHSLGFGLCWERLSSLELQPGPTHHSSSRRKRESGPSLPLS